MEAVHNTRPYCDGCSDNKSCISFLERAPDPDCSHHTLFNCACPTVGEQKHDGCIRSRTKKPLDLAASGGSFVLVKLDPCNHSGRQCLHPAPVGKFGRLWIFFYLRRGDSRKQEQPEETPSIAKRGHNKLDASTLAAVPHVREAGVSRNGKKPFPSAYGGTF